MTPELRTRDFTLAALTASYPSAELEEVVRAVAGPDDLQPLWKAVSQDPDELRAAYLDCFDIGKGRVPVYETEYGRMRGLAKGKDLADVVGFYQAFGLDMVDDLPELPDHVAIELEFYALLLYKQGLLVDDPVGTEIVLDARRKFLVDHLGGFAPALAARVSGHPIYGPVFGWCARLVADECRSLGVVAAPLDFFADGDQAAGIACGGCVAGIPPTDVP